LVTRKRHRLPLTNRLRSSALCAVENIHSALLPQTSQAVGGFQTVHRWPHESQAM